MFFVDEFDPSGEKGTISPIVLSNILQAGIRTPATNMFFFAWLVENKGNPKKAKKTKNKEETNSGEVLSNILQVGIL